MWNDIMEGLVDRMLVIEPHGQIDHFMSGQEDHPTEFFINYSIFI